LPVDISLETIIRSFIQNSSIFIYTTKPLIAFPINTVFIDNVFNVNLSQTVYDSSRASPMIWVKINYF